MQTVLMAGWLALTLFLIYKVTEDKGKIFVILILYFFINNRTGKCIWILISIERYACNSDVGHCIG